MKIIYIKGEFAEAALKINEPDILFSSIASNVKKVIGAGIGEDDIEIHLPELKFFKAYIEDVLEEKITSLEKDKYADTEVKYNGRILHLNIRNHKHRLVDSLIRVYKIVEIEINKSGCLYIYNLSALDNVSTYIVMTVKALNTRE